MFDGVADVIDGVFGRTTQLAHGCARCRKPEKEVGELRIYPPLHRTMNTILTAAGGLPQAARYCGPCAIYKAVEDAETAWTQRRGRTAQGPTTIQ